MLAGQTGTLIERRLGRKHGDLRVKLRSDREKHWCFNTSFSVRSACRFVRRFVIVAPAATSTTHLSSQGLDLYSTAEMIAANKKEEERA